MLHERSAFRLSKIFFKLLYLLLLTAILNCQPAFAQSTPKNVLLICVDDLRPELKSFGAKHIHSPNIDALAATGRAFVRHYVNAPSCGPSRYTLLTGCYGPGGNGDLFDRAAAMKAGTTTFSPSMPKWFQNHGYRTVSVGKVSHHPGGRGGKDWDDDATPEMINAWDEHLMPTGPWQHPRGAMHGLANGEIRGDAQKMPVMQSTPGPDTTYPDGLITNEAIGQIEKLAALEQPFFLAVGLIRPHLPWGAPKKYMRHYADVPLPPIPHSDKPKGKTTWHGSGEFMKYFRDGKDPRHDALFADKVRRHYAACVSYADAQVGRIVKTLQQSPSAEDTIIVLWGDHGWHLGEHGVWGKHTLFEESLHSPLIIVAPEVAQPGIPTQAMVSTDDIFPTLCELAQVESPDFLAGQSLMPQLKAPSIAGHDVVAYHRKRTTLRTEDYRLIVGDKGHVELYDHTADGETNNIAGDHPELVRQLTAQLEKALVKRWGQ
jgi:iduronate 2-sulfatase